MAKAAGWTFGTPSALTGGRTGSTSSSRKKIGRVKASSTTGRRRRPKSSSGQGDQRAASQRKRAVSGPSGRSPLLLPGRYGVGALPPLHSGGGGRLPSGPRRQAVHRDPGGGAGGVRRAHGAE